MKSYGYSGPTVVVPARVAFLLWRKLPLADFRGAARNVDPELHDVLVSWQGIADDYLREATRRRQETSGSAVAGPAEVPARSSQTEPLGTSQVADLADITERAVRLAADEKRLTGTKDNNGVWQFRHDDVADWLARRRTA